MDRYGAVLSLQTLVVIVLGVLVIAIIILSFSQNIGDAVDNLGSSSESEQLRVCEENINSYCRFNPGADWSDAYEDCTQYRDTISGGDTTCSGTSSAPGSSDPSSDPDSDDSTTGDGTGTGGDTTDGGGDTTDDGTDTGDTTDTSGTAGGSNSWNTDSCSSMGGSCIERTRTNVQLYESNVPETSIHRDTEDCGSDEFCYVPVGSECRQQHDGMCKPSTDYDIFEERDGEIVSADCTGFCYVPAIETDTCGGTDYCMAVDNTDICPGVVDDRGEQDGCFTRETSDGDEQEMACCRQIGDGETVTEEVLDIDFISAGEQITEDSFDARVSQYTIGMQDLTPLGSCWDDSVNVRTFGPSERRQQTGDITITVESETATQRAAEEGQGGRIDGEAYYNGGVTMYANVPETVQDIVAAHEVSHVVGICDEYSREAWDNWNTLQPLMDTFGGCPNDWPTTYARHPSIQEAASPQQACQQMGGTGLDRTCGRDLDETPDTPAASIMGTTSALNDDTWTIPLEGLPQSDAETFRNQLEEQYGVVCE